MRWPAQSASVVRRPPSFFLFPSVFLLANLMREDTRTLPSRKAGEEGGDMAGKEEGKEGAIYGVPGGEVNLGRAFLRSVFGGGGTTETRREEGSGTGD